MLGQRSTFLKMGDLENGFDFDFDTKEGYITLADRQAADRKK